MNKDDDSIGCWQKFTALVSSLWDTSDMKVGEEKEVIVRTTLRELVVYMIFLAILCIVTLSAMFPTMYKYTNVIKTLFKKHEEVSQVEQFWNVSICTYLSYFYLVIAAAANWIILHIII